MNKFSTKCYEGLVEISTGSGLRMRKLSKEGLARMVES